MLHTLSTYIRIFSKKNTAMGLAMQKQTKVGKARFEEDDRNFPMLWHFLATWVLAHLPAWISTN